MMDATEFISTCPHLSSRQFMIASELHKQVEDSQKKLHLVNFREKG